MKWFLISIVSLSACTTSKPYFEYTFEKGFDDLHPTSHKNPWAFVLDSSVVRSGKKSVRFEVRKGDYRFSKRGKKSSRAELATEKPISIGQEYWFSFSLFIPANFPIEDNRLVLGQWWSEPDEGENFDRSPPMAFRYRNGMFYISLRASAEKIMKENGKEIILFETKKYPTGKWVDFIFNIKWSYRGDGFVDAWMNENKIIKYSGPTGYNDDKGPSFQFGIYRDETEKTYVVYFDDIRVGPTRQTVEMKK
ncbi:MAG: heparin lyase I family protein [Halobacteriovoraceae bacterium]|nr:heparin lyase I family protein [Halobacteriovoraceae bacterium]MCB9095753.1 heparin lyase I family protein [Halobacteriovoraceae bacterium]